MKTSVASYQSTHGVVDGGPGGGVPADAPAEHDDVVGPEAELVDGELHHHVDGVVLLRRVRETLPRTDM